VGWIRWSRSNSLDKDVIDDLYNENKKVIFTMGKGGVGKTTVAAAIALGLSEKGKKVHLTTTDPAAHLKFVIDESSGITMSHIDEHAELKKYQDEVLKKARETMSEDDIAYVEEDLRSPCTQEIAVFRAFAEIVEKAEDQIVVIDTAPTGHTLLLLESTQSYNHMLLFGPVADLTRVENLMITTGALMLVVGWVIFANKEKQINK